MKFLRKYKWYLLIPLVTICYILYAYNYSVKNHDYYHEREFIPFFNEDSIVMNVSMEDLIESSETRNIGIIEAMKKCYNRCPIPFTSSISFKDSKCDSAFCYETYNLDFKDYFSFSQDTVAFLNLEGCRFKSAEFGPIHFLTSTSNIYIGHCRFTRGLWFTTFPYNVYRPGMVEKNRDEDFFKMGGVYIFSSKIDSILSFRGCKFKDGEGFSIDGTILPKHLDLCGLRINRPVRLDYVRPDEKPHIWAKYDISRFLLRPVFKTTYFERCGINLTNTDLNFINIDYTFFKLEFDGTEGEDKTEIVYRTLLEKFKKEGRNASYELLDQDYRDSHGGVLNFFSSAWWNYGYSKERIFLWSFLFVGIFSIANYRLFPLVLDTYPVKSVSNYYLELQGNKELPNFKKYIFILCFLYTCILFFGIKLDPENLNMRNFKMAIFLIFQFVLGLICAGFILNLIVN